MLLSVGFSPAAEYVVTPNTSYSENSQRLSVDVLMVVDCSPALVRFVTGLMMFAPIAVMNAGRSVLMMVARSAQDVQPPLVVLVLFMLCVVAKQFAMPKLIFALPEPSARSSYSKPIILTTIEVEPSTADPNVIVLVSPTAQYSAALPAAATVFISAHD